MKKILIAICIVAIMLMLPISTAAQTQNIENIKKITSLNDEIPKFYITEEQKSEIDDFVNSTFDENSINDARDIVSLIILENNFEIDTVQLANFITTYIYRPIPDKELNLNITRGKLDQLLEEYWGFKDGVFKDNDFSNLINKILEIIKARLGWLYQLYNQGINLFKEGFSILKDLIDLIQLPTAVITLFVLPINLILKTPDLIAKLLDFLFSLDFANFMDAINDFLDEFGDDLTKSIDEVNYYIQLLVDQGFNKIEDFLNRIKAFFENIQGFIAWIMAEPWTGTIQVKGTATKNFQPFAGATIKCRNIFSIADSNGEFNFAVESNPDNDTIPSNSLYGMHNCTISILEDDTLLKQSPRLLSYVFAGGEIEWKFIVFKGRSREIKRFNFLETIMESLQKLFSFFGLKRAT